jgi:predicted nucleic acid-binding protein
MLSVGSSTRSTDVDLVFDNTCLSHFARAGRLSALEKVTDGYRRITPAQVSTELIDGVAVHPALAQIVSVSWLEVIELTEIQEVVRFAHYKSELGGGAERNNGEAAVLAWVAIHGGVAVIDERTGTRLAQRDGLEVHGTLWLVVNAFKQQLLDRQAAERIVDELASTEMLLPTDGTGFFAWAYSEGLLP